MSRWINYNLAEVKVRQTATSTTRNMLSRGVVPVYRVAHGMLVLTVFLAISLWLSGNGTNAGAFDLARILVPEEARHVVWSNGFGMLEQYKAANESPTQMAGSEITAVIYNKSNSISTGFGSARQKTVALLMPSVAQTQVKSISYLADQIPTSRIDPQALDTNLMGSIQNQRAVADFFEKKYKLERSKIEEYVSSTILIAKEVNIDPVLLLAVISVESNFNPTIKSHAGAEGLMQVMTSVHKDKYDLYGGTTEAVKPEVNIRVGAYILKYLIATAGSLRNGLKFYVGAANAPDDGGYTDKVMAERNRLISLCQDRSINRLTLNGKNVRS